MSGDGNIWIALLRGINVGGKNKLAMKDLVATFEAMGFEDVKTYIQSGNVVFCCDETDPSIIADKIKSALLKSHNIDAPILTMRFKDLQKAAASNPFEGAEPASLHLFFMASAPLEPDFKSMDDIRLDSENYALVGRIFYFHTPDGFGRSKLAARIEKLLGVETTARNWRSVTKIIELAGSD